MNACAEEDASELDRLRRLLCIPREEVDKVNKEICGRIYQDVSLPAPVTTLLQRMQHIMCSKSLTRTTAGSESV